MRELRIGNYVFDNSKNKVVKISQYDFFNHEQNKDGLPYLTVRSFPVSGKDFEPILLTKEIMEKNDFCYCERDGGFYAYPDYNYDKCPLEVILFNVNSDIRNNQIHIEKIAMGEGGKEYRVLMLHLMECNFVHQLQNIFIDLDIDKEIVL